MAGEAIFIGYRRDDTADVAGRIYDAMAQRFGRQRVFKDVDNIGPGVDFSDYIKGVLPRCRVALVLIGPQWLESETESGRRRLDDDHDLVRIEIETALATPGLLVVPVLVNGARMPRSEEVPESVRPLLRRNAAIIRRDPDFHDDVERLAAAIRASVNTGIIDLSKIGGKSAAGAPAPVRERNTRTPLLIGGAIAGVLALVALGYGVWRYFPPPFAGEVASVSEPEGDAPLSQPATQPDSSRVNGGASAPALSPATGEEQSAARPPQQARTQDPTPAQTRADQTTPLPEMVRIPGQSFEVSRYEVTFAQWDACVDAGGCNGFRPRDHGGRGNRPVINITWNDAQSYVQWLSQRTGLGYRLLTSAEWEIAARAGSTTLYSWGDQPPACDRQAPNGANVRDCAPNGPLPVGSFRPNSFGLYDMHGGAWEWVDDCFTSDCSHRRLRGGAWNDAPAFLRTSYRYGYNPDARCSLNCYFGIRLGRSV